MSAVRARAEMPVNLRAVSVSRDPKSPRFARMWKLRPTPVPVNINIRQGLNVGHVLSEKTAALLLQNNVIRDGMLHVDALDAFLTDDNLKALKSAGMKLRVGNEFDRANTREAIIGRLADERDDYFVSRYEKKHAKVSGAIRSLVSGDVSAWHQKKNGLLGQEIDLSGANLSRAKLKNVDLKGTKLYGADLSYAKLTRADLSGVDATGAYLWDTNLSRARLIGTRLPCANLSFARLYLASMRSSDLVGAVLSYAKLERADLTDADIQSVDFVGADLGHAKFKKALFSDAVAGLADFTGADLSDADLSGTDFGGASFSGATISGAKLSGTNFAYAVFHATRVDRAQHSSIIANPIYGESTIIWGD